MGVGVQEGEIVRDVEKELEEFKKLVGTPQIGILPTPSSEKMREWRTDACGKQRIAHGSKMKLTRIESLLIAEIVAWVGLISVVVWVISHFVIKFW